MHPMHMGQTELPQTGAGTRQSSGFKAQGSDQAEGTACRQPVPLSLASFRRPGRMHSITGLHPRLYTHNPSRTSGSSLHPGLRTLNPLRSPLSSLLLTFRRSKRS